MDDEWLLIIICIVVLALVCGCGIGYDVVSCNAKTQDMGFNHKYSIFGGCLIEVNPGKWIPLESYYFKQE